MNSRYLEEIIREKVMTRAATPTVQIVAAALAEEDAREAKLRLGDKLCIECHKMISRTLFYKNSSAKDGLQSRCRACEKQRSARKPAPLGALPRAISSPHTMHARDPGYEDAELRLQALDAHEAASRKPRPPYVGVTGGYLIYGYVRGD